MKSFIKYLFFFSVVYVSCKNSGSNDAQNGFTSIAGETMGTTYHITYESSEDFKAEIDSLLVLFNNSVSTYIPESTISQFNKGGSEFCYSQQDDQFLLESLSRAMEIAKETNGAFDPTVMPLVNYWGFGYGPKEKVQTPDKKTLDSLVNLVGYKKIGLMSKNDTVCIFKENANMQLDLSASAKGHGVDVIASFLASQGIENYLVEIGGELIASGYKTNGKPWVIGINRPQKGAAIDEIQIPIDLSEKAMATSGNYRNYYESGNITYAHTINPKTGDSTPSDILSASIIANDCLTADGYATACMVLGLEKSKKLINENPNLEACFIYANSDKTDFEYYFTPGFSARIDTSYYHK